MGSRLYTRQRAWTTYTVHIKCDECKEVVDVLVYHSDKQEAKEARDKYKKYVCKKCLQ